MFDRAKSIRSLFAGTASVTVSHERIAIVGMGGVFPGATDLAGFWRNVAGGVDCGRPVPPARWALSPELAYAPGEPQPDHVYSTWGCYLDDFSPDLSGLPVGWERALPTDLKSLDPLFAIGLHAAAMAWRDAGSPQVDPVRGGAIFGHIVLPTESTSGLARDVLLQRFAQQVAGEQANPWNPSGWSPANWQAAGLPAAIVAGALGLSGPSCTLDAACASSLYALKLACDELLANRADIMLAGGLSRPDCQYTQMGFTQLKALSRRGRCAPLSAEADGLVVGEGAGLFVLKRLSDALRDGNRIYATIAGIGLSNDRGANLLAPHSEGQLRAMRAAYGQAGWQPGDVDLIECHATGTPVGDGVELESLHALWSEAESRPGQCVLGSVKSNVGHLLTAAGGASLMKLLWAFQSQTLPPTANYREPAKALQRDDSPFRVLSRAEPWQPRDAQTPRRAAINAFGFGGINAHVLLEEYSPDGREWPSPGVPLPHGTPAVAIIGMSARIGEVESVRGLLPGNRESASGDWESRDNSTPIEKKTHPGVPARSLQSPHDAGGFAIPALTIPELQIPISRFRIPPLELPDLLPQQQLMLQVADRAISDAGVPRELGDRTGVFIGISLDPNTTNFHCRWMIAEYARDWAQQLGLQLTEEQFQRWVTELRDAFGPPLTANRVMGNLGGIVASRLGREFDVGGPCFTISCDEASGLRAFDTAVRDLQRGDIDQALVGSVDLRNDPRLQIRDSSQPPADGAVALILQRKADAERSNHRIYALVQEHPTLPVSTDPPPQLETEPARFDLGSNGQLLPMVQTAGSLFHRFDSLSHSCWFTDRQCLRQQRICSPDSAYGSIQWWLTECRQPETEQTARERRLPAKEHRPALFVVTGDTIAALQSAATALRQLTQDHESGATGSPGKTQLLSIACRWFQQQPPQSEHRFAAAIVADTVSELQRQLQSLQTQLAAGVSQIRERGLSFTSEPLADQGQLAFVFPGSGNHFLGMGREFLAAFPEIVRRQEQENDRLRSQYRPDVIWHAESTEAIGRDHKTMIFGQVAIGTAVCDWLAMFGVRPTASIGYSLGESAAFFGLRAWQHRDEMLQRMEQSTLFGSDLPHPFDAARAAWNIPADQEVPWLSGVINRGPDVVRQAVEKSPRTYLLIINTPSQCVIGGDRSRVEQLARELNATFVPFAAPSTVHCPILNEVSQAYTALHLMETTPPAGIEFYSGASGRTYELSREAAAGAILAQAVGTVDFPRVIQNAWRDGVRLFVEIGPGSSCTKMIGEILGDQPHGAWAVLPATADPVRQALSVLGELITHRVPVDLTPLYGDETALSALHPENKDGRCVVTPVGLRPWVMPSLPLPTQPSAATTKPAAPNRISPASGTRAVAPASLPAGNQPRSVSPAATTLPAPASMPPRRSPTVASASTTPLPFPQPAAAAMSNTTAVTRTTSVTRTAVATDDSILQAWEGWMNENIAAHEAFLRFSQEAQTLAVQMIGDPERFAGAEGIAKPATDVHIGGGATAAAVSEKTPAPASVFDSQPSTLNSQPSYPPRSLTYDQCMEFAIGKIGNALGPMFAGIDSFPTRVRLPDVPLMLVDRILEIEGEPLSMTHGRVVTEKDIVAGDWYLDCGKMPTCLAVESGQADLFLSGWLGIDLQTRGLASYRLLDAVVTFHDELPGPGQTIHYDIRINHFFQQGDTYLFRFEFDATVNGQPLLTMRDGCAGFFTPQELAAGQGIIQTTLDRQPRPGIRPNDWRDPVPMGIESYSDAQLAALRAGDLASCFGPAFQRLPLRDPVTLPTGRLNLVHRVLKLDPTAGKYGLGQIRAEADIHPDDWFLTCHFCDDQVMPGTLMYECCLHTLRIYLLRMGWIGEAGDIAYEPIPGIRSRLKCRGQVLATTKKVWYEVTLKEIGYGSRGATSSQSSDTSAYAIADALMYADGKPIVEITDMTVRLTGLTREKVEELWGEKCRVSSAECQVSEKTTGNSTLALGTRHSALGSSQTLNSQPSTLNSPPLFSTDRITAFAIGKPSEAFGDRYRVFDHERKIARLPGPPFQFLDRIVSIENCQPWVLEAGGVIVAEYDVPPDAWYFAANRSQTMPFAVLLETALQPCGWLAGYLGSALTSDIDLKFRNLGGKATQFRDVTPESGTLSTTVRITRVSNSAGMIIQHFDYDLRCNGEPVYVGNTYFGFFSQDALANQIGIRDAKDYQPTSDELARARSFPIPLEPPFPDEQWNMVRRVDALVMDGGPHGLGYVRGSVDVDPSRWFFQAHFYEDPVWPGSLGLESFLQLLQVYAEARWSGLGLKAKGLGTENASARESSLSLSPQPSTFNLALNSPHEWLYRGQVIPRDKMVTVDVVVTAVDDVQRTVTAGGFLTVDGRVIYQMIDFCVRMGT